MLVPNFFCRCIGEYNTLGGLSRSGGGFSAHHLNVQRVSGREKFDRVRDYLNEFKVKPTIFGIAETWFLRDETGERGSSNNPIKMYEVEGYVSEYCSRDSRFICIMRSDTGQSRMSSRSMYLREATCEEVFLELRSLDPMKSCGYDGISNRVSLHSLFFVSIRVLLLEFILPVLRSQEWF